MQQGKRGYRSGRKIKKGMVVLRAGERGDPDHSFGPRTILDNNRPLPAFGELLRKGPSGGVAARRKRHDHADCSPWPGNGAGEGSRRQESAHKGGGEAGNPKNLPMYGGASQDTRARV